MESEHLKRNNWEEGNIFLGIKNMMDKVLNSKTA